MKRFSTETKQYLRNKESYNAISKLFDRNDRIMAIFNKLMRDFKIDSRRYDRFLIDEYLSDNYIIPVVDQDLKLVTKTYTKDLLQKIPNGTIMYTVVGESFVKSSFDYRIKGVYRRVHSKGSGSTIKKIPFVTDTVITSVFGPNVSDKRKQIIRITMTILLDIFKKLTNTFSKSLFPIKNVGNNDLRSKRKGMKRVTLSDYIKHMKRNPRRAFVKGNNNKSIFMNFNRNRRSIQFNANGFKKIYKTHMNMFARKKY